MRSLAALAFALAVCGPLTAAAAADCPGHPHALGTSRTIVVDSTSHPQIGTINYSETLPLADHEVVLTFDDGPRPPFTTNVLDTLANECVKATFFIVGEMARAYPDVLRRVYADGHTIGTHSQTHPTIFDHITEERAESEIDQGIASTAASLGDAKDVAPFFRYPGLGRTMASEDYLARHDLMVWSADVLADDWKRISAKEIVSRAITRLDARGKGILLLHDIHPGTAVALPTLLRELKERGYRVVHIVPASPDRPKTATLPQDWVASWATQKRWPRIYLFARAEREGVFAVPGEQVFKMTDSYARSSVTRVVKTEVVERTRGVRGRAARHRRVIEVTEVVKAAWPQPAQTAADAEPALPAPSVANAGVEYALLPEDSRWTVTEGAFDMEISASRMQTVSFTPRAEAAPLP